MSISISGQRERSLCESDRPRGEMLWNGASLKGRNELMSYVMRPCTGLVIERNNITNFSLKVDN